jgi:hypothetical protein
MTGIGKAASFAILVWAGLAQPRNAGSQDATPPPTMEMTIVGTPLRATDGKIYVNELCQIFPGLVLSVDLKKRPEGEWNSDICRLEKVLDSEHQEEKPAGDRLQRSEVEVREEGYVLQNITLQPQVFAVLQMVPAGWVVTSEPKPAKVEGEVAIFEVHAGPGQTVRLHVEEQHTKGLKEKALPAAPEKP